MEEYSLFDFYSDEFEAIKNAPSFNINVRDTELLEMLRTDRESHLSKNATKTSDSRGRRIPEDPCPIRSCYERDYGRIVFSQAFRRLRNKTQVFFNPTNDHLCSRMEHVIYVDYISSIIGRALNLNTDLIHAIAIGHDIGHTPFGHTGERVLSRCMNQVDDKLFFEHERHGLRIVDVLEEHKEGEYGLNLSFEVRDGIVSHCGETYNEHMLVPKRDKTEEQLLGRPAKDHMAPATLEGCVVRFADKIAYVGRDMEDALRAGIIGGYDSLPQDIVDKLGNSNSETINVLVADIIYNSFDKDAIVMSDENFQKMNEFLEINLNSIYKSKKISTYEKTVSTMIEALFDAFLYYSDDIEKAAHSENQYVASFGKFMINHPEKNAVNAVKVADYIAGMTDNYATACFDGLFRA